MFHSSKSGQYPKLEVMVYLMTFIEYIYTQFKSKYYDSIQKKKKTFKVPKTLGANKVKRFTINSNNNNNCITSCFMTSRIICGGCQNHTINVTYNNNGLHHHFVRIIRILRIYP